MTVFPVFSLGIGSADHCFYLVQNDRISTLSLDGQPPDSLPNYFRFPDIFSCIFIGLPIFYGCGVNETETRKGKTMTATQKRAKNKQEMQKLVEETAWFNDHQAQADAIPNPDNHEGETLTDYVNFAFFNYGPYVRLCRLEVARKIIESQS